MVVATAPTVAAVTVPILRLPTMATADTPCLTIILRRLRITTLRPITRPRLLTAIAPVAVVAITVVGVAASTVVVAEVEAPMVAAVVAADPMAVIINA
jgi:hypothetical protein